MRCVAMHALFLKEVWTHGVLHHRMAILVGHCSKREYLRAFAAGSANGTILDWHHCSYL